jgi:hypothetical protein
MWFHETGAHGKRRLHHRHLRNKIAATGRTFRSPQKHFLRASMRNVSQTEQTPPMNHFPAFKM